MNTLKGLSLTALLLAGSMSFISPTQATTEAPTQATTQAIEAPVTDLSYPSTTITTSPAPTTEAPITEAPVTAPTEAIVEAPTAPILEAPLTAPVTAPTAPILEQPTAAPEAPTAAPTAPYSGPLVDCATQGLLTGENNTCVRAEAYGSSEEALTLSGHSPESFRNLYLGVELIGPTRPGYRAIPSVLNPSIQYIFVMTQQEICSSLEPGDAWAGVGTFCQIGKEVAPNLAAETPKVSIKY